MEQNLEHHGIKGMKWGVRRTPEQLGNTKNTVDGLAKITNEANKINSSVAGIRSTAKKKDLSKMTDQELRDRVNRMNLEQQFSQLSSNQVSKGQAHVKNVLEIAGSTLAIGSSAIAIAIGIKNLKG